MSDLYLKPTEDGGDLVLENGRPETTSGLSNAIYLSLFTPAWWGNGASERPERYGSRVPELLQRPLTARTARDIEVAAESALAWMKSEGLAGSVEADSEIVGATRLHLRVRVTEPSGETTDYAFAVNWETEEAEAL